MEKRKPGRPRRMLDERQIRELANMQCTMDEMAAVMNCDEGTLRHNYSSIINAAREGGKSSLRRAQWKKAVVEGNPAMLIWLGKHYLGQKEDPNGTNNAQIEVRTIMEGLAKIGSSLKERKDDKNNSTS